MQPYTRTSRRDLLRACVAGALPLGAQGSKSRVVIARDPALRPSGGAPDSARLLKMLDRGLQALTSRDSPVEAWKSFVRPGEVVGLKVNCLAGRGGASTNPLLVEAVCERLQQAGVPRRNIVVWDRLNAHLERAGYRINPGPEGIRVIGNDAAGYEQELSIYGAAASLLATTLTRVCDVVINLPVLKDHGIVGVTMALKNFYGAVHNPNKYHVAGGDPYVADVYMLPPIRAKARLAICDAIAPQFHGGPSFMPQWSWPFQGLLLARDPVALDTTGWGIIEKKRAEMGRPPLAGEQRAPAYIARAAAHGIGVADPARIEVVEA